MSTLSEMVDELKDLVDRDVKHDPAMHEYPNHCEGCERVQIANMIRDHLRFEDDTAPQRQFGGKSQSEVQLPVIEERWGASKTAKVERAARLDALVQEQIAIKERRA